ncbi:uncharacterized protein LOC116173695 [Photinus pyralis]|uniref:uncharacterized protein LOC116173695 n=1 Tax=Photinus pyralis TaxID=7054 RepID=UPI001266EC55|nr:uncharacterized protein LOC116173695 [Photinus pyralis]
MNSEHSEHPKLPDNSISRNNRKKLQKENKQQKSNFKIHPIGGNLNLISEDFAKALSFNSTSSNSNENIEIDDANFPSLGQQMKHVKKPVRVHDSLFHCNLSNENLFSLQDFIQNKSPISSQVRKQKCGVNKKYSGNPLDAALPVRKSGKFRDIPKSKKHSKLKRDILMEKLETEPNCTIYLKDLCNADVVTDDESVCSFIARVVELQEKLYKRDPIKGKSKRRFVVGLHEAKKYLTLNRVKVVIIAADIRVTKENGAVQEAVEEIINLCKQNYLSCFFALKKRKLGTLTLKSIPISCITVMNYEGAEEHFRKVKTYLNSADKTEGLHSGVIGSDETKILELLKNN